MRKQEKEGTQMDDAMGGGPAPSTASRMMTPLDIQQQEFRTATRGYKMRDVDEFLDQITDAMTALLAENERLRAGAPASGIGAVDPADVNRQSDEIIARARDEAARIVAEAREQAAVMAGAGAGATDTDRTAVNAFLVRERDFLQSLAGLVQGHAESVKGMAKAARQVAPQPSAAAEASAAPTRAPESAPASPSDEPEMGDKSSDPTEATTPEPAAAAPMEAPATEQPVVLNEPEPASVGRTEDPSTTPEDDSSLRELFWGED